MGFPLRSMHAALLASVCSVLARAEPPTDYRSSTPMADGEDMGLFLEQTVFTPTTIEGRDTLAQVNGHLLKVRNPSGRFAFVPPLPGGCGTLQEVRKTAKQYEPGCTVAVNAGYFDLHEDNLYGCIGHLVSDGKIHHTEVVEKTNVNFGVLKNGSFFVGYVTPDDIKKGEFLQLIGGLGWLVRDGTNQVKQGWKEAYTGACSRPDVYLGFASGRTAIGYDKDGGLIVLQYDGQSRHPSSGVNLFELADKMIEFGAVEAINLDGGGSTQMWRNGEQLGYSSDRSGYGVLLGKYPADCPVGEGKGNLSEFECPREVSSILCIHDRDTRLVSDMPQVAESNTYIGLCGGVAVGLGLGIFGFNVMKKKRGQAHGLTQEEDDDEDSSSLEKPIA